MLQNPSKYHPNPLTHFLALHSSSTQNTHNAHAHPLPLSVASANQSQFHHQHAATAAVIMANHHHQQQQQHYHSHNNNNNHHHSHAHLIDANTSLDVGKSFTIAAILGLQKSAIENNQKEYNNVINLSLNGGNNSCGSGNNQNQPQQQQQQQTTNNSSHSHNNNNTTNMDKCEQRLLENNNNNNSNISNNNCKTSVNSGSNFSTVNNFNCDSKNIGATTTLLNRYLPSVNVSAVAAASSTSSSTFTTTASYHHHQQQQHHASLVTSSQQVRVNSFASVVAAAAAANANGAPSALQSLQQLHQHHAQQTSLSFQREKLKAEGNAKKSSLKNKRVRTIFTPEQLERLEAEFERQQYMVGPERLYLAHTLQLTEAQVKVWFQNRRIKWRKHHLEITQQRLALLRQTQLPPTTTGAIPVTTGTASPSTVALTSAETPSPSCEEIEDVKMNEEFRQLNESRNDSESDLSICNDSLDADSIMDGGEDT